MSRQSFSVQVQTDNRWMLEAQTAHEAEAMALAESLIAAAQHEGIRVLREWQRSDGTFAEKEIFSKKVQVKKEKKVTISPVEETTDCASADDIYGTESRTVIGKLLRKYLDELVLTATEFLHHYPSLKRFLDSELYPAAVDRIATLQVGRSGGKYNTRRDQLFKLADEVVARARAAEAEKSLWKLPLDDLPALAAAAAAAAGDGKSRDLLLRATISRTLVDMRVWTAKLDRLLPLVGEQLPADLLAILDGFICDILAVPEAVQDLVGPQPNLARALGVVISLITGGGDAGHQGFSPSAMTLCLQMAAGRLPDSRAILVDRIRRQVQGPQPLSRNDPALEEEAFRTLFASLVTSAGLLGGPAMSEALTVRYIRRLEGGVTETAQQATTDLAGMLTDRGMRLRYLLSLAETETGRTQGDFIGSMALDLVQAAPDIHSICYYRLPPVRKLGIIGDLMRLARGSTGIPGETASALFARLDKLLVNYIDGEKLIEKLDSPEHPLSARALRLVKFCGSGVLPESDALSLARQRVIDLLRRPRFVEEYTAAAPNPATAEKQIRAFRVLLRESGFEA